MMATPPSFRGGSQSSLTANAVEIRVNPKFRGGEGGPGKNTQDLDMETDSCSG